MKKHFFQAPFSGRKYGEVAKVLFKAQLAWRFDIAFNMLFTITKILFAFILWGSVFGERNEVSGFTFDAMLSYYIISSFVSQLDMSGSMCDEISDRIRNGAFSKYMVVPANTLGYFGAQNFGAAAFYLIFNLIAAVTWTFVFRVRFVFTGDIRVILAAVFICMLGLIFMVQLNYFLGILTFKWGDIWVFLMIKNNLVSFVTGTLIPLALFPEAIVDKLRLLPFYYVTYLPSMLFIGRNTGEALTGILTLLAWITLFIPINALTYKRLRTKYDGVGI